MDSVETSSRAAIALVVTLVLLGAAWVAWRRRGPASGLRWLGVALLPVAAWLTGTLGLISEVVGDIGRYVTRLVLSPVVWSGVVVLVVAVLLILGGGAMRTRGIGVREKGSAAGTPGAERPPVERKRRASRVPASSAGSSGSDGLDDDVNDILRKHGIS